MLFEERSHAYLRQPLQDLTARGVFIGTSSWKYPGWCGQIYDGAQYFTRKRFSESRFERECLAEYASVLPAVCVDAGYYAFPSVPYLQGLCSQVPDGFRFGLKVTDAITIKHFPNLPRFGDRAGKPNPHFLDAELFRAAFLSSCDLVQEKIGVLIFEFSHFHPSDFAHGREFMHLLDAFLAKLPKTYAYAVEIRNSTFLQPEYFAMLGNHGVAHVFNSWTRMPGVEEQIELPGSITTDFTVARCLLKPGRSYAQAVSAFSPYNKIQDRNETVREAAAKLIMKSMGKRRPSFVFVNNRLEGNAIETIAAIVELTRGKFQRHKQAPGLKLKQTRPRRSPSCDTCGCDKRQPVRSKPEPAEESAPGKSGRVLLWRHTCHQSLLVHGVFMSAAIPSINWQSVKRQELPPMGVEVWTFDMAEIILDPSRVRKGLWHFEFDVKLEQTPWTDLDGHSIVVTHWCPVEDSPEGPPIPTLP